MSPQLDYDLERSVALVTAAATLARYWPTNARHEAALTLSGALRHSGWPLEHTYTFVETICRVAEDEEISDRLRTVTDTYEKTNGEVTDWPHLSEVFPPRIVEKLREWISSYNSLVYEEDDIQEPLPVPDLAILRGLIGLTGQLASDKTEANPFAVAMNALAFISAHSGKSLYFPIGDDFHHPSLYFLHVGRSSGGRKGTATKLVARIDKRIREEDEIIKSSIRENNLGVDVYSKLGISYEGGLSSREGLVDLLPDDGIDNKGKFKKGTRDKRVLFIEPEYGNVLKQSNRQGNTLLEALMTGWDGRTIAPLVRHNKSSLTSPHIAIMGSITPVRLKTLMGEDTLTDGFAGRHIIFFSERIKRVFPMPTSEDIIEDLAKKYSVVIDWAIAGYPENPDSRKMTFTEKSFQAYQDYVNKLEIFEDETIDTMLHRRDSMVIRVAMIYAISDMSLQIKPSHIESAIAVMNWWRDSVLYFKKTNSLNNIQDKGFGNEFNDKLCKCIKDSGGVGISQTGIYKYFNHHVSSEKIGSSLKFLASISRIKSETVPTKGREKTIWKEMKV